MFRESAAAYRESPAAFRDNPSPYRESPAAPLSVARIRADIADCLGDDPADIPLDENLLDHGLDSVRVMALLERWRETHDVHADFTDLAERPTVDAWARLLGAV
ncbi:phosphopantetheine-binding protein [Streptomyces sp. NPDC048002]|uniref:phosphopantetheine-binding protein n=1 Tax=unclassified Streptomyces TaxID=2593676 RepID=UPI0033CEC5AA